MSKDKRSHETLQLFYTLREKPSDDTIYWTEHWIDRGADLSARDYRGRTPLHIAAEHGHCSATDMLVVAGADPNLRDRDGRSPIDIAASTDEGRDTLLYMLRGASADALNHPDANGMTPLHWAAYQGQEDHTLQFMINQGADPAIRDQNNHLPTDRLTYRESYASLLHGTSEASQKVQTAINDRDNERRVRYEQSVLRAEADRALGIEIPGAEPTKAPAPRVRQRL
ncbi:ankyrin repeat domain-containing protein [Paraburkholderia sp. C35]|uniref:ankyrin repeat domain-containing protein n=1 Tax=Paraburkholderia sp. C35 TaxID=2126993 RepID=UPI000D69617B|nr:ankyrin repeat domain-containing protein [Paraburkholderia sp. C35]